MRIPLMILLLAAQVVSAQIRNFPFRENFDSVATPLLPSGWEASFHRDSVNGDFTSDSSSSHSMPNALLSKNARIEQTLTSPVFDFRSIDPESLFFWERRSASHNSGIIIEYSTDGGDLFSPLGSDTLRNPGTQVYIERSIGIPPGLSGNPSLQFRWRIIGNGDSHSGSGTFRIDDIMITATAQTDAAIESIGFLPTLPYSGDSLVIQTVIRNRGSGPITGILFRLYDDRDADSTTEEEELLDTALIDSLIIPGDWVSRFSRINGCTSGRHRIMAVLSAPGDQVPANDRRTEFLDVGLPRNSIVVNEIMYAPASPEPEWFEITGNGIDSVNLKSFSVTTRHKFTRIALDTAERWYHKGDMIVCTRDSAALSLRYPDVRHILAVERLPASYLTNDSDCIYIRDERGAILDSVPYSSKWGGLNGRSLERKETGRSSSEVSNWGTCTGSDSGTPGAINSITPLTYDLCFSHTSFSPPFPVAGHDCSVIAVVRNRGLQSVDGCSLECYETDSGTGDEVLLASFRSDQRIGPGDSLLFQVPLSHVAYGSHYLIFQLISEQDEEPSNNRLKVTMNAGYPRGTVAINEIQYDPPPGEPEWVEILNTDTTDCDLSGWKISNRNSTIRYTVTPGVLTIAPDSFCVITKDTALLNAAYPGLRIRSVQATSLPTFLLSNSGDAVVLSDSRGAPIDSVRYFTSWGGTDDHSLERIDALQSPDDSVNWAEPDPPCRSTPGMQNTRALRDYDLRLIRISSPDPAPESVHLLMTVGNCGRNTARDFSVYLYRDTGNGLFAGCDELLDSLRNSQEIQPGDTISLPFDWKSPGSGIRRITGVLHWDADQRGSNDSIVMTVAISFPEHSVIINEIMYDPLPGAAEYVELCNPGGSTVDLNGWKLSDVTEMAGGGSKNRIRDSTIILKSSEYCVVSPDTIVFRYLPVHDTTARIIVVPGGFNLNNAGDDIILTDPTGKTIDSVHYLPSWHNPMIESCTGKSLERINPGLPGTSRANWSTSADATGGTPCRSNSLYTPVPVSQTAMGISPNPFSPDGDGSDDITILHYSLLHQVSLIRVRIFDSLGRPVRTLAADQQSGPVGDLIWDGTDDHGNRIAIGIYIVLLEAVGEGGDTVESAKDVVVVGARF